MPGYPKYLYGSTFRLSPKVFDAKLLNYEAFCNVFSIFKHFPQGVRHFEHEGYFYFFGYWFGEAQRNTNKEKKLIVDFTHPMKLFEANLVCEYQKDIQKSTMKVIKAYEPPVNEEILTETNDELDAGETEMFECNSSFSFKWEHRT